MLKELFGGLLWAVLPYALIVAGIGFITLGLEFDSVVPMWLGAVDALIGVVWAGLRWILSSSTLGD